MLQRTPYPIKGILAARGITIRDVARAFDINEGSLSRVLNRHQTPWPALRARLAEYLDLPEEELFADPTTDLDAAVDRLLEEAGGPIDDPGVLARVATILCSREDDRAS